MSLAYGIREGENGAPVLPIPRIFHVHVTTLKATEILGYCHQHPIPPIKHTLNYIVLNPCNFNNTDSVLILPFYKFNVDTEENTRQCLLCNSNSYLWNLGLEAFFIATSTAIRNCHSKQQSNCLSIKS